MKWKRQGLTADSNEIHYVCVKEVANNKAWTANWTSPLQHWIRAAKTGRELEREERRNERRREPFLVTSAWITSLPRSWTSNAKEKITPQTCNTCSQRQVFFPALQQEQCVHYTFIVHTTHSLCIGNDCFQQASSCTGPKLFSRFVKTS